MVKIKVLPDLKRISGMKGTIDFYVHKGVPCARGWPRKPHQPRSPAVLKTAANFAYIAHLSTNPPPIIKLYAEMIATWVPLTWKDIVTSAYYGNLVDAGE